MLKVCNIVKYFEKGGEKIDVLKGIDLTLGKGELVSIVGASGVGKSTLLHLMGGLDYPTDGKILYNDVDITEMEESALANFRNKTVGFVFQFHYLLREFNAIENVMIPAIISGLSKKIARENAMELLSSMGLSHRITHKPGELSGGEQQRVAIARSLIMNPTILLADEPTGNLDPATGERVSEQLFNLNMKYGITMVIVTHNSELARNTKRILKIEDGKIVEN